MIVLKSPSISKIVIEEQEKIKNIVYSFYEDNFDNLCMMNTQKVAKRVYSLLLSNTDSCSKTQVYNCYAWRIRHTELIPSSYLKREEKVEDTNFYVKYQTLHINKPVVVEKIDVMFRCKGLKNNYFVSFLMELDMSLKHASSLKLSSVNGTTII